MIRRRLSPPTRLRLADAISEAVTSIVARPARAVITCIGTLLGVAWFVTALGLASTANAQVTAAFARHLPTHVLIGPQGTGPVPAASPYPIDVERRLDALHGVVASGVFWRLAPRASVDRVGRCRGPSQRRTLAHAGARDRGVAGIPRGRWRPGQRRPHVRRLGPGAPSAGLRRRRCRGEGDGASATCGRSRPSTSTMWPALSSGSSATPASARPCCGRSCSLPRPLSRSGGRPTRAPARSPWS